MWVRLRVRDTMPVRVTARLELNCGLGLRVTGRHLHLQATARAVAVLVG